MRLDKLLSITGTCSRSDAKRAIRTKNVTVNGIVAKNADKALAKPTSTSQANFPAAEIEKVGNLIYDIEDTNTQTFTLGQGVSEGTLSFDFTYNNTGYRLYYSTNLKMRATSNAVNAATSWAYRHHSEYDW